MRNLIIPVLFVISLFVIGFLTYRIKQLSELKEATNLNDGTTICTECKSASYNDISFEEFEKWVQNFRNFDLPALEEHSAQSPGVGKQTHSVWADLNQLENFICLMRRKAAETQKNTDSLGVRFYFIKYDANSDRSEYSVVRQNPNKLSVALIPTYCENNINYDFEKENLKFGTNDKAVNMLMTFDVPPNRRYSNGAIPDRFNPCPNYCDGAIFP